MKRIISGAVLTLTLVYFLGYSSITGFGFTPPWLNFALAGVFLILLILAFVLIVDGCKSREEKAHESVSASSLWSVFSLGLLVGSVLTTAFLVLLVRHTIITIG